MPRFGGAVFVCPTSLRVVRRYKTVPMLPHGRPLCRVAGRRRRVAVATLPPSVAGMRYSIHMAIISTSVRFDSVLDGEIRQFAATMRISYTAAIHVLIVEALMARGMHKEVQAGEGADDE